MLSIFVLSLLNGLIFGIYCYVISFLILQKTETNIKKIIVAFIPFFILYYCILCLLDSFYTMFFSGLWAFFFIKMIFQENMFMSLLISLILHIGKITIKILILTILNNDNLILFNTYRTLDWNAFYINLIVLIIATILIFVLRKPLRKVVKNITFSKNRKQILLVLIYLNYILVIMYQPPCYFFSLRTITDAIIIFTVTGIGIFNISSEMKMETLTKYYQEIFEYSKANGELLTHYKMQVHENKNRLLMIKGMLDGPKKETKKYIDSILKEINDNKSNANYWLAELKYIPLPGIRNFINYKLIRLTELGAEIEVFISSELERIEASSFSETDYNELTTILGVVLDNMIESVQQAKEKLISISIYIEDDKIHAEFVNSFSGNIDLGRLNEVGYTTKGEQHGIGLPLVAKITKSNNRFTCTPEIIDNFFIQHITIKIIDKTNLQKISKK